MRIKSRAEAVKSTDLADPLGFKSLRKRFLLLERLREEGYLVRMHAYEYVVGDGRSLVAIVILEPSKKMAEIVRLGDGAERIGLILEQLDPQVKVIIRAGNQKLLSSSSSKRGVLSSARIQGRDLGSQNREGGASSGVRRQR